MIPRISLRQALADPALLGGVLEGESWKPWRTLLLAAMGDELTEDERPDASASPAGAWRSSSASRAGGLAVRMPEVKS